MIQYKDPPSKVKVFTFHMCHHSQTVRTNGFHGIQSQEHMPHEPIRGHSHIPQLWCFDRSSKLRIRAFHISHNSQDDMVDYRNGFDMQDGDHKPRHKNLNFHSWNESSRTARR